MSGGQADSPQGPQSAPSGCPPLIIVADDLTGACDAAVAFTSVYDPVRVQIAAEVGTPSCVCAITTESRSLPPEEAELRVRNIVGRTRAHLFKKIDSVFRGNTVSEIAVTLRHAHFDLAILAPAYPALGRTIQCGVLHIQEPGRAQSLAISDLLAEAGCSVVSLVADQTTDALAVSLKDCIANGTPAALCDASTQLDLTRIVRAAHSLDKRILLIGSGGLAHALAAEFPVAATKLDAPIHLGATIFFVGSPHAVSRAQINHLREFARVAEYHAATSRTGDDDLIIPVQLGSTTPEQIRHAVAAHAPAQIGCLFMTGGDTAHFVCRALDIQSLRLLHEFAPGVPVAVAEGGPFDGVRVVLKSGGFGEPDLLCRLLEAHRAAPEVIA